MFHVTGVEVKRIAVKYFEWSKI